MLTRIFLGGVFCILIAVAITLAVYCFAKNYERKRRLRDMKRAGK